MYYIHTISKILNNLFFCAKSFIKIYNNNKLKCNDDGWLIVEEDTIFEPFGDYTFIVLKFISYIKWFFYKLGLSNIHNKSLYLFGLSYSYNNFLKLIFSFSCFLFNIIKKIFFFSSFIIPHKGKMLVFNLFLRLLINNTSPISSIFADIIVEGIKHTLFIKY